MSMLSTYAVALAGVALSAALVSAHEPPASVNAENVTIVERDGYRHIRSNGLPGHETGAFPSRANPNRISEQNHAFRVTLDPQPAGDGGDRRGPPTLFGVALNGVPFDPGTAEIWRDGEMIRGGGPREGDWNEEAINGRGEGQLGLDGNRAHVQPTGMYHYHGVPWGLIEQLAGDDRSHMLLIGWAADGFPIYAPWGHKDAADAQSEVVELRSSYALREENRPIGSPGGPSDGRFTQDYEYREGLGDLDRLNGREGVTPEFPDGTFYYVVTEQFPFVAREHHGTPDESFMKQRDGARPRPRR